MKTAVIVIGAGPVGLMLAGELRLGGVDVVVYEKLQSATGESRAGGFNRRVAEVLDQRGLLTRFGDLAWGGHGQRGISRVFGGVQVHRSLLKENHSGVIGLPQSAVEQTLDGWLTELGVPIRRGHEAVGFRETADGVVVSLDGPDGRSEDVAEYLVGCDGAQSTIRSLAGIDAPGWDSTRGIYTAEITGVELRRRPAGERLPDGAMIVCTGWPDGSYRIVIQDKTLPPDPDPATLTFTEIADAWQRLTGESIHNAQVRSMWARGDSTALAAEYRRGRVFLAGDAAHDVPPQASFGMSVGMQDAVNLGWKLAAAVNGGAPDGLLDSYHTERHPIGQQLVRDTRAASILALGGQEIEPLRNVLEELATYENVAAHLAGMVSGLSIRYDMGPGEHPMLGLRMPPYREVELADGTRVRVAELLRSARGVFVSTVEGSAAARLVAGWADRVDVVSGGWVPVEESGLPAMPQEALIRPDGYVAWAAPGGGDLSGALSRWFGSARALTDQPTAASS